MKKQTAILLFFALLLALCSCGKKSDTVTDLYTDDACTAVVTDNTAQTGYTN